MINYYLRLKVNEDTTPNDDAFRFEGTMFDRNEKKIRPFAYRVEEIVSRYNLSVNNLAKEPLPSICPGMVPNVTVCNEMFTYKKSEVSTNQLKTIFQCHLTNHSNTEHYYTDGSKTSDGTACAFSHNSTTYSIMISPIASIYTAELRAIIIALRQASVLRQHHITIITDSKSAIQGQMKFNSNHPLTNETHHLISCTLREIHA